MHVLVRICTVAALAGLGSASLPKIPFLGDNVSQYQYVYWIGKI